MAEEKGSSRGNVPDAAVEDPPEPPLSHEEEQELLQVSFQQMLPEPPAAKAAGEQAGAGDDMPSQKPWMCYNVPGLVGKAVQRRQRRCTCPIDRSGGRVAQTPFGVC